MKALEETKCIAPGLPHHGMFLCCPVSRSRAVRLLLRAQQHIPRECQAHAPQGLGVMGILQSPGWSWARSELGQGFPDWQFRPHVLPAEGLLSTQPVPFRLSLRSTYKHYKDNFVACCLPTHRGKTVTFQFLLEELTEWRSRSRFGWSINTWHFYSCLKALW